MLFVTAIVAGICFACFVILLCGDPSSPTILGRCHHHMVDTIPEYTRSLMVRCGLKFVFDWAKSIHGFFFLQRNPFVLILYLALVLSSFTAVILKAYPQFPNRYFAEYHQITGTLMMILCLFVFYKAATVDAGHITKDNLADFDNYAYDDVLYNDIECSTCKIPKLARSKHCRVMDMCVSRFDHYCIWLNRAIGERNYRWFLSYLIAHSFILFYGVAAVGSIFLSDIENLNLWGTTYIERSTNRRIPASYWIIFYVLFERHYALMFVFVLCSMMSIVLTGFTCYHLYLAITNTTTNETSKWSQVYVKYEQWLEQYHYAKTEMPRVSAEFQRLLQNSKGTLTEEDEKKIKELREKIERLDKALASPPPQRLPENIYDRGWKENILEVIFPLSLRTNASNKHAIMQVQVQKGGRLGPTHRSYSSEPKSGKSGRSRRRKKVE